MKTRSICIAAALLLIMGVFMLGAARQDSATVDETTFLSAGYTYWTGHRFMMVPEHPPLSQMLPAVPLLFTDLKYSPSAQALLDSKAAYPWTRPWAGPIRPWQELFPGGRDNWYYWALPESQLFGQLFVYDGTNDGQKMLYQGRCVQVALTLAIGLIVFLWIRQATGNDWGAVAGLAAWTFHPSVLAHGHLITTDIGVTLGIVLALFLFGRWLERPTSVPRVVAWGAATACALLMKFTAVILAPIFVVLVVMHWRRLELTPRMALTTAAWLMTAAGGVLLLMYFPRWTPPPSIPESQAVALGVPGWFTTLRPALIPADFFKGLALTLGHAKEGHDAYLMGSWSQKGGFWFYPAVYVLKSPVAFVLGSIIAAWLFVRRWRESGVLERVAWGGTMIYLAFVMAGNARIGIRHILPVLPLVCIGIGCAVHCLARRWRWPVVGLLAWQAAVAIAAYPLYLQFFSEGLGGAKNGYRYLVDSNYDWGQDAERLQRFLTERKIDRVYLDYFGTQYSIEYLKIPNTRVNAAQARQIKQGWLVVSASQLMRPEWAWLRESRPPTDRVAHTLFVYRLD